MRPVVMGLLVAWCAGCDHAPGGRDVRTTGAEPARDTGSDAAVAHPVTHDAGVSAHATTTPTTAAPTGTDATIASRCAVTSHVTIAPGWQLRGFHPGPAFADMTAARHRRIVAWNSQRVCTSDDDGGHWNEQLALDAPSRGLELIALDSHGTLLAIAKTAAERETSVHSVYLSHGGDAEHWARVALPHVPNETFREAFTDGLGRMFATSATHLFESDDAGGHWLGPRSLPGQEARDTTACGPILMAHVRVDDAWYYHRTFDRGMTWRPFRLGVLGLEADRSVVRCITERGGIEAGRPPLPSSWSWDGGIHWGPSGYDVEAQRIARTASEDGATPASEFPHCRSGPGRSIECVDSGRSRTVDAHGNTRSEVHSPSLCEHVRQIDHRRTVAFGPACGIFVSIDRGGRWRMQSQSLANRHIGTFVAGRGGWISEQVAWRLDGGVWWTFDAGVHWQPFFSIHARSLERGVFVDRNHGVFATNNGWVVATSDGGHTFTFVQRGAVERIATTHRAVVVTLERTVRVSPDGGRTWLATGTPAPSTPLDPEVEVVGQRRSITFAPGNSVVQDESSVQLEATNVPPIALATGLPPGYQVLAVHATAGQLDRVLLEGGAVLVRD